LRNTVNRDKSGWVIAAYQIELLVQFIFKDNSKILEYRKIEEIVENCSLILCVDQRKVKNIELSEKF